MKLKVVMADDEALARRLLSEYLTAEPDLELVAECSNGFDAVKAINNRASELKYQLGVSNMVLASNAYDNRDVKLAGVSAEPSGMVSRRRIRISCVPSSASSFRALRAHWDP